jgi:hypothetical protein
VVRRHEDWHAGWARMSELLLRLPLVVRVVVAAAVVALAAVVSIIMVDDQVYASSTHRPDTLS